MLPVVSDSESELAILIEKIYSSISGTEFYLGVKSVLSFLVIWEF
jgi:hypothetical protein